jgi:tetratricopeptide (TPR) repeat protein
MNNAIIKANVEQALARLREDTTFASRGLHDLGLLPKIDELLKQVEQFFNEGQYQKCIAVCNQILSLEIHHFAALLYKSLSYEYIFEFEQAITSFKHALQVVPNDPEINAHIGACYLLEGDDEEAEYYFKRSLDKEPTNVTALYYKGLSSMDEITALSYWDSILKKYPHNTAILIEKGDTLVTLGRYTEAITNYATALQYNPVTKKILESDARLYVLQKVSDCYKRIGRFTDARTAYKEILEIDPENSYALNGLKRIEDL